MLSTLIILLTLATAAIHACFFIRDPTPREAIYGLNALGYVTLVALLYLPLPLLENLRRPVRRLLMGYAAVTIAAYFIFGLVTGEWTVPLGPLAKVIEVSLIGLLWWEGRRSTA